jgi:hypothetical protein
VPIKREDVEEATDGGRSTRPVVLLGGPKKKPPPGGDSNSVGASAPAPRDYVHELEKRLARDDDER